jgi:methyl-accepting chemotaxis protein
MKMIRVFADMKMSMKLMVAPTAVIVFLLVLGWVAYQGLFRQKHAMEDVFNNRFKKYQTSATVLKDLAGVHACIYKVISWANAKYDEKKIDLLGKEQIAVMDRTAATVAKALESSGLTREEKEGYQAIAAQLADYRKTGFSAIDLATSDLNMATMYMENADTKFQALNKSLHDLLALETKLSQEGYDLSMAAYASSFKILIGITGIAIVVSILISLLMSRRISRPLRRTMDIVKQIAEGDLTQELQIGSEDEIGELAESVNTMRVKMGDAVGQSVAMSQTLSEAASEQAASLEETSSSLEEMTSMTKQNAGNATEANRLMNTAQEVIQKADGSMGELTGSMHEIAKASEQTQKIVKTIDEIAFQTNLLALNAAVEAARAGEAGAGFAVVADEVRNLALRAAEAAKSTSGLMEDIVRKVKNGEQLVGVTNEAFRQITESSTKVVKLIGEIAGASREQSEGIEQVNKAVAEMSSVTQRNAAGAEELASVMAMFKTHVNASATSDSPKAKGKTVRALISSGKKGPEPGAFHRTMREVRPEEVIPLDDDHFKEF